MKKLATNILIFTLLMLLLAGCGLFTGDDTGTVTGYVFAPDGVTPIVNALVTAKGTTATTYTDGTGYYSLTDVPVGTQTIVAVKGNFKAEFSVEVSKDETTNAPEKTLEPIGLIGVAKGAYDDMGEILDILELPYETVNTDLFSDPEELAQYAVIFFECGFSGGNLTNPESEEVANLRDFIADGGSIYASDWAAGIVDAAFPDEITFLGKVGNAQIIEAEVLNSSLIDLLDKDTVEIDFDLSGWEAIDTVAEGVTVDIQGDIETSDGLVEESPILVHFSHVNGFVIYTAFHNEANVTEDMLRILEQLAFGI